MKRLLIIVCCLLIVIGSVPAYTGSFVFAYSTPSDYTQVTNKQELVNAFLAYCRSRDSELTSSVLGATTTYTYNFLVKTSEALGISLTDLQAQLYYQQQNNGVLRWFITQSGINHFNDLFAYLIQEHNLEPGDSFNGVIDSGIYFTTLENYTAKLYVFSQQFVGISQDNNYVVTYGTDYKYPYTEYYKPLTGGNFMVFTNNRGISYSTNNSNAQIGGFGKIKNLSVEFSSINYGAFSGYTAYASNKGQSEDGVNSLHVILYRLSTDSANKVKLGAYNECQYRNNNGEFVHAYRLYKLADLPNTDDLYNTQIYFISNNITNSYQGDTIINNEGDIIYNDAPQQNPEYDPYPDGGGTVTDPNAPHDVNNTDNLNFNFPNLDIDLPEIDWSIGDLSNKFPFSIPFDLYNMFNLLNTDPQTPEIKGTVDLGIYEWAIDWDLHQFDDTAALLRNVEFIGFVIGLIFITRSIIKG